MRVVLFFCFFTFSLSAQMDSVLTIQELVKLVKEQHPVSMQNTLRQKSADLKLDAAQGAFDPKLESNFNGKNFDDKNYFQIFDAGLTVPTKFGPRIVADYSRNTGDFLNPENFLPDNGLASAGIELPLLQGLLMDTNRAKLAKAKIDREAISQVNQLTENALLIEALSEYLKWSRDFEIFELIRQNTFLAQNRLSFVRIGFEQGDRPAMDTIEISVNLKKRKSKLATQQAKVSGQSQKMLNFIWSQQVNESNQLLPQKLDVSWFNSDSILVTSLWEDMVQRHPKTQQLNFKLEQLDIDRSLAKEFLKPKLDLKYNPLISASQDDLVIATDQAKYGVSFSMPIFLRKGRAENQLVKIQQEDTFLEMQKITRDLETKLTAFYVAQGDLINAINQKEEAISFAEQLVSLETEKFELGESSLFVLNSRETNLLSLQMERVYLVYELLSWKMFTLLSLNQKLT